MQKEVEVLHKNQTWKLMPLPPKRKLLETSRSIRSNVIAMTK